MPKKKNNKMYFTQDTEDAIIEYNKTDDLQLKNKLYEKRIKYPFEKLAENILNTFKFSYFDVSKEDIQSEVVSTLIEKIHMYKEGKGKAFSYFSIVAKHYLILKNNANYKRFKQTPTISEMPEGWTVEDDFHQREMDKDYKEFKQLMLEWWDENLNTVFNKRRDIQIADAVLELMRRSEYIENFKKKHLYLLIREMAGCKTHYITKVVNTMKEYHHEMFDEYLQHGTVTIKADDGWGDYQSDYYEEEDEL